MAIYQFVDHHTTSSTHNRRWFWNQLDEGLTRLPKHNLLLCAGDLNCNLQEKTPWTGPNTFKWSGRRCHGRPHDDSDSMLTLLQRHGLSTLNTWTERTGPSYVHGEHVTKIDYIMTRLTSCDGLSRDAQHLHDADIVPWSLTYHVPVRCTVRTCHTLFHVSPLMTSCTFQQRTQCRRAFFQDSTHWDTLRQHVQQTVQDHAQEPSPNDAIFNVHQAVLPLFHQLFPKHRRQLNPECPRLHELISTGWEHKRAAMRLQFHMGPLKPHLLFQAWFHWCKYRHLQRLQQKQARLYRHEPF